MKKILLTAVCLASLSTSQAQIDTLYRPDMSYPTASFQYDQDTSVSISATFGQSGQNQVWDFSASVIHYSYVSRFLAPDANNGGNAIQNCDLVIQNDDNFDEFLYMNESNESLIYLRASGDTFSTNLGQHRSIVFPLHYGRSWTDSSSETMVYPGSFFGAPVDSIKIEVDILVISTCDGSGWLKLPLDSVEVLRVKQEFNVDYLVSAYMFGNWSPVQGDQIQNISYNFYNEEGGYSAAMLTPNEDDPLVGELNYRSQSLMAVKPPAEADRTLVYPNPSHGSIYINADKEGQMTILDLQGKVVKTKTAVNAGVNTFNAADLSTGTYLVFISYADGSQSVTRLVKK